MSIKKTLGGDRLGSGKKMKVELHNYERSTHNLGYIWRSTMSAGTLVPFLSEVALPGDTFDIDLDCDIKTHPTIGPLFGSYKVQLDVFFCPIRLYQGQLHNNKLGIGMNMANVKLPLIDLTPKVISDYEGIDIDNAQINPSCILSYLGLRGIGINKPAWENSPRSFNAVPLLAYWDIYKQYYANKQEELGAVIHGQRPVIDEGVITNVETDRNAGLPGNWGIDPYPSQGYGAPLTKFGQINVIYTTLPDVTKMMFLLADGRWLSWDDLTVHTVDDGTMVSGLFDWNKYGDIAITSYRFLREDEITIQEPEVVLFPLNHIDQMRENILAYSISGTTPFKINIVNTLQPYKYLVETAGDGAPNLMLSQEGLGLKTYQSDLFNNWLQTEWIDGAGGINEITAIDTSGGSFNLDTLNLSKKVYEMLNRIAVSGGSYDDWLDAVYAHDRYTRAESPVYMGGLIKELVFQEVVSNAASSGEALGTLAGKGVMANKHKGGKIVIKTDEIGYIIGIVSLTPRVDYSQGNKWDVHLKTMDDFHKPGLDEIGFQELITEQMAWWDTVRQSGGTGLFIQKSAGKQPAWINYMTNVNQVRGNFAIDGNEMFMTLNRRYEFDSTNLEIQDLTTYIDPKKFNNIFADTARDAQNFWTQISVDMIARRKMSAKIMPNL